MRIAINCTVLAFTAFAAGQAATISFLSGGLGGSTNLNNGNVFNIALNGNGSATNVFVNNTGQVIKDFHFAWTNNENNAVGEDDFPAGGSATAFGSFTAAAKTLDFFNLPGGAGIPNGMKFSISIAGFANNVNTNVMANPTFNGGTGTNSTTAPFGAIPEPSYMLLVGGVLGLVAAFRNK